MYCSQCGSNNSETSKFCGNCGSKLIVSEIPTEAAQPENDTSTSSGYIHASFGRRATAYMIDYFLIASFTILFLAASGVAGRYEMNFSGFDAYNRLAGTPEHFFVIVISGWLYFALMESLNSATLGKLVLGLRVTERDGCMLSFGKATGRFFAKMLSGMILCIGYLMALSDKDKYTMHDNMTKTQVIEVKH